MTFASGILASILETFFKHSSELCSTWTTVSKSISRKWICFILCLDLSSEKSLLLIQPLVSPMLFFFPRKKGTFIVIVTEKPPVFFNHKVFCFCSAETLQNQLHSSTRSWFRPSYFGSPGSIPDLSEFQSDKILSWQGVHLKPSTPQPTAYNIPVWFVLRLNQFSSWEIYGRWKSNPSIHDTNKIGRAKLKCTRSRSSSRNGEGGKKWSRLLLALKRNLMQIVHGLETTEADLFCLLFHSFRHI